jgi:hypothetical protein
MQAIDTSERHACRSVRTGAGHPHTRPAVLDTQRCLEAARKMPLPRGGSGDSVSWSRCASSAPCRAPGPMRGGSGVLAPGRQERERSDCRRVWWWNGPGPDAFWQVCTRRRDLCTEITEVGDFGLGLWPLPSSSSSLSCSLCRGPKIPRPRPRWRRRPAAYRPSRSNEDAVGLRAAVASHAANGGRRRGLGAGLASPRCRRARQARRVSCKVEGMDGNRRPAIALGRIVGRILARSGILDLVLIRGEYGAEVPLEQKMPGEKDQGRPRYRARHLGITTIEAKANALRRRHGRYSV